MAVAPPARLEPVVFAPPTPPRRVIDLPPGPTPSSSLGPVAPERVSLQERDLEAEIASLAAELQQLKQDQVKARAEQANAHRQEAAAKVHAHRKALEEEREELDRNQAVSGMASAAGYRVDGIAALMQAMGKELGVISTAVSSLVEEPIHCS